MGPGASGQFALASNDETAPAARLKDFACREIKIEFNQLCGVLQTSGSTSYFGCWMQIASRKTANRGRVIHGTNQRR